MGFRGQRNLENVCYIVVAGVNIKSDANATATEGRTTCTCTQLRHSGSGQSHRWYGCYFGRHCSMGDHLCSSLRPAVRDSTTPHHTTTGIWLRVMQHSAFAVLESVCIERNSVSSSDPLLTLQHPGTSVFRILHVGVSSLISSGGVQPIAGNKFTPKVVPGPFWATAPRVVDRGGMFRFFTTVTVARAAVYGNLEMGQRRMHKCLRGGYPRWKALAA